MSWAFGRQTPDNSLMRFASYNFGYRSTTMLDIGSGEGANARELRARNHCVITVDKDPTVECNHPCDIRDLQPLIEEFDLIYDINTLCHVENPPFARIASWIKPGGVFFSICPRFSAPDYICAGKDFTRRLHERELLEMLRPFFTSVSVYRRTEPDFGGQQLKSWIAVCRP